jgi:hypothetical protein
MHRAARFILRLRMALPLRLLAQLFAVQPLRCGVTVIWRSGFSPGRTVTRRRRSSVP